MKSLYTIAAALTLLATPVLAADGEIEAQTSFYQPIPAHQAVIDLAINGPAGDAEAQTQNIYTIQTIAKMAATKSATATDAALSAPKPQAAQDDSWRNQP